MERRMSIVETEMKEASKILTQLIESQKHTNKHVEALTKVSGKCDVVFSRLDHLDREILDFKKLKAKIVGAVFVSIFGVFTAFAFSGGLAH